EDLHKEINNLELIGLGKSKNANYLREMARDYTEKKQVSQNIQLTHNFLKYVKDKLPDAIILPYDAFYKLLEKFNLLCGPIDSYGGLIPQENIDEITKASAIIEGDDKLKEVMNAGFRRLSSVVLGPNRPNDITFITQELARIPYVEVPFNSDIAQVISKKLNVTLNRNNFSCSSNLMTYKDWIIVAPADEMKNNVTIEIVGQSYFNEKKKAEDPLLCKFTKYGVVICSAWGEEANSDIYKKYVIE
ncbi:MAG: hypothetical protein ACRCS6_07045, partial [Turicibacter sp.]